MKYRLLSAILFAVTACYFYSCEFDNDSVNSGNTKEISVDGFITDEQGLAVIGASVEFGNNKTSSNEDGYFQFPPASFSNEVFIKVNKFGYFPGSRTLFLDKSRTAQVKISLLQKSFSKSFNSTNSATLNIDDKVKLEFPAQSITDQNGLVYNGTVNVAVKYLDPSNNTISEIMPGNLVGINTSGEIQQLGSFGMAAIELQSYSGSVLKIKENAEVVLKIQIPAALQANAPASIPLWYFDESKGLWKEEGSAIKNGSYYEGKVHHFSFWNCDDYFPTVHLTGTLVDSLGKAIYESNVSISIVKNNLTSYGWTNGEGIFEGMIPKNEIMYLNFLGQCGGSNYTMTIGPFSDDVDLGVIKILQDKNLFVSVAGKVVDCNNYGLPSIHVNIQSGRNTFRIRSGLNGIYQTSIPLCGSDFISIVASDWNQHVESITLTYKLDGPIQAEPLQICKKDPIIDPVISDEYIKVQYSDGTSDEFEYNLTLDNQLGVRDLFSNTLDPWFEIKWNGIGSVGTFTPIVELSYVKNNVLYVAKYHGSFDGTILFSKIPKVDGEFYEATFKGIKVNKLNTQTGAQLGSGISVSGSFKIKKK